MAKKKVNSKENQENSNGKAKSSKEKTKSLMFTIVLTVIVIAVFAYLIMSGGNIIPENSGKIAATVNREKITEAELDSVYGQLPEQYRAVISKEDILGQLIDKKLLLQEAKKKGISVSDNEVEEQIAALKMQFPDESAFNDILKQQNITLKKLKEQIKEQLIINKVLNESVISMIEVSDKEMNDYYNGNKQEFTAQSGQIRAAHILVDTKEEADGLISMLNSGADFGELAAENSIDPSVKLNKGDLGFFSMGDMVKEFEDAAFKLKVGDVSPAVESDFGYHIIKRLPNIMTFDESKDIIYSSLLGEKQSEAIDDYLNGIMEKADIKKGEELTAEKTEVKNVITKNEFLENVEEICTENGMPVIRRYIASNCEKCSEFESIFKEAVAGYNVVVYEWELDTGDNLYTKEIESSIPKAEFDILKKYNPKGAVPAYVFGCKYVRIGNAFIESNPAGEKQAFAEILEKLK